MKTFKELGLKPALLAELEERGFTTPTEIQALAIPQLLTTERIDFHGQAQTGTGKTLAFGLPLLNSIDASSPMTQALIIAPTRELVVQITESLQSFQKAVPGLKIVSVYGGASMTDQLSKLKRGAQIVVGTPGRLKDHLRRKTLSLKNLKILVLDEADIMLDMGFKTDIDEILTVTKANRSIWLFSATVKKGIRDLMKVHMPNPISARVSQQDVGTPRTKQYFCVLPRRDRVAGISRFIDSVKDFYGFIFCPTKILAAEFAEKLIKRGYSAAPLHGDMNQAQRNKVIKRFKDKDIKILVCTDVAARGIDIADISHVINYALPDDEESYVHRIGRTGRAGKEGIAITFVTNSELRFIRNLQKKFNVTIEPIDVPTPDTIAQARLETVKEYLGHEFKSSKSPYMKKIEEVLADLSPEETSQALAKLVFDKFFRHLITESIETKSSKSYDLSQSDSGRGRPSRGGRQGEGSPEIYINVGSDDDLTKEDVLNYIEQHSDIRKKDLDKVKLVKRRTYIAGDDNVINTLYRALRGHKLGGRKVMCFMSNDHEDRPQRRGRSQGGGGYGRSGGGRSGGGRSGGGRRR